MSDATSFHGGEELISILTADRQSSLDAKRTKTAEAGAEAGILRRGRLHKMKSKNLVHKAF